VLKSIRIVKKKTKKTFDIPCKKSERLYEEFVRGIRSWPAVTTRDSFFVKVQKIIDHRSGRAAIKIKRKYFPV